MFTKADLDRGIRRVLGRPREAAARSTVGSDLLASTTNVCRAGAGLRSRVRPARQLCTRASSNAGPPSARPRCGPHPAIPGRISIAAHDVARFIEELCKANPYQETPILRRGFYFTSGTQVGRPTRSRAGRYGTGIRPAADARARGGHQAVSYFVTDFSSHHFSRPSSGRTFEHPRAEIAEQRLLFGGAALFSTMLVVLPATISYMSNADLVRATALASTRSADRKSAGRGATPSADHWSSCSTASRASRRQKTTFAFRGYGARVPPPTCTSPYGRST